MKQDIAEKTTQLPSLRIAYKNQDREIRRRRRNGNKAAENAEPAKDVLPMSSKPAVMKEPLPLFDDYKFKAKDYDPL